MKTNIPLLSHLAQFYLEWEMFQTKIIAKIKHTSYVQLLQLLFGKPCCFLDNVEKYCTAAQASDDKVRASCMLDT